MMGPLLLSPRSVVPYVETSKVKRNKVLLRVQSQLLSALYKLHPLLTFRRKCLEQALLHHSKTSDWLTIHWSESESEQALWAKVSSRRLMAMLRHCAQSLLHFRGRHVGWIFGVLEGSSECSRVRGQDRKPEAVQQEPSFALSGLSACTEGQ